MAGSPKIAVIGGGIGGLTVTLALLQRGFDVQVYESAPELKEIGAGVALGPNAMKAFRSIGMEDQVRAVGFESEYQFLKSWKSSRVISKTSRHDFFLQRYGATGCTVHRADLLDALAAAVPRDIVHLGARCTSVETSDTGARAKFNTGEDIEADVVIGADGIHSAVRTSLFGPDAPRFTGKICYRCVVPIDAVPGGWDTTNNATWLGPHGAVVVYLVRRGELINVVAHHDDDDYKVESWIVECDREEVIERYSQWHESLRRLFSASKVWYKWALFDRDPIPQYTKGRTAILGDAAHPMLPYLGQGAGQAIEDGCVLAMALDGMRDDPATALQVYEQARRPRASHVVLEARARGVDNHLVSPWAALKRDVMIALRRRFSPDHTGRGGTWIFDYDAAHDPVVEAALAGRRAPVAA